MLMPSIFGENLFDDVDDWFNFPDVDRVLYGKNARNLMKTDVQDKDGNYEVAVDLPGFKKDEVKVQLKDGQLTISAGKGLDKDDEKKDGRFIRRERYEGSMTRSFYVGDDVKESDIHASFEDGVLRLTIPKKEEQAKVEETEHYIPIA